MTQSSSFGLNCIDLLSQVTKYKLLCTAGVVSNHRTKVQGPSLVHYEYPITFFSNESVKDLTITVKL